MRPGTKKDAAAQAGMTISWVEKQLRLGKIKPIGKQLPGPGERGVKLIVDLDTVPVPGGIILFDDIIEDFPSLPSPATIEDLNESLKIVFKDPCVNDALHSKLHSDWAGLQEKNMGGK